MMDDTAKPRTASSQGRARPSIRWVASLGAAIAVGVGVTAALAAETAIAPLSGDRFVHLCAAVVPEAPIGATLEESRCVGFVQGTVNALDMLTTLGVASFCRPAAVTVRDVILLFKTEAALYPEALDQPAAELIAGMFVKFFPCR